MKDNLKIMMLSSGGVILMLSVVFWFFILQPEQQLDEKQAQELLVSGINLFNEKKYKEALETLQRIPSGSAHEAKARYYQGSAHMMLKDYDAAMSNLQQALVLDNHDTGVMYALGVVSYKLGNIKLAKSYFASVLEINPEDQQAKGLMDIMARLERRSVANPESELNKSELLENKSQQTNLTSTSKAKESRDH
jgi:tetratricopeptide (TPR) repeat protein